MGKNKNWCMKCTKKHYPPTGKKCLINMETQHLEKAPDSVAVEEDDVARDCLSSRNVSKSLATAGCSTKTSTTKKNLFVDGPGAWWGWGMGWGEGGGPVDVVVNRKVAWPHEHILGG